MNKTLKRWLYSGDDRHEQAFNLYYRFKRQNRNKVFSGWMNSVPVVPVGRVLPDAIPSVAFNMIKRDKQ